MFSHTTIIGRVTRDPESKYTEGGVAMCKFSVAVDQDFKNKETGEKETDFFDCIAWRSTADFVGKYILKGRLVVVSGRMQCRKVTADDGTKRTYWSLNAQTVQALDRPRSEVAATEQAEAETTTDPYSDE